MKKILCLILALVAGVALAADYTPVTKEVGKITQLEVPGSSVTDTNGTEELAGTAGLVLLSVAGSPTGAVCTVADIGETDTGFIMNIVNVGTSNSATFVDSGNLALSGDAVLGPNDTLTLIYVSSNQWVEAAQVNN